MKPMNWPETHASRAATTARPMRRCRAYGGMASGPGTWPFQATHCTSRPQTRAMHTSITVPATRAITSSGSLLSQLGSGLSSEERARWRAIQASAGSSAAGAEACQ